jgi:hypothetical protein
VRVARSRPPGGTVFGCQIGQGSQQNVQRSILVSIHHQAARWAHVRPHREAFLVPKATAAAILGREPSRNGDHAHAMKLPIIAGPPQELAPGRITAGLCQMVILHQVGNLQVFVGNHIRDVTNALAAFLRYLLLQIEYFAGSLNHCRL